MTDREVARGLRVNIVACCLGMMWFGAINGPPTTMLIECMTGSGILIGLLATAGQLALLAQFPGAVLMERLHERKKVWATLIIIHRLMWFIPALVPLLVSPAPGRAHDAAAIVVVAAIALSAILGQAGFPSWLSWVTDLVPKSASGRFWGVRQSISTIPFLAATIGAGLVLDAFVDPRQPGGTYLGFTIVFAVAAILGMSDIVVHLWVPEPRRHVPEVQPKLLPLILSPLRSADFRWMTLAIGAWFFGIALVGSFSVVYLKRAFHVSYTELSLLTFTGTLGPILASFFLGRLIDRIGARSFGAIILFAVPLLSLVWFFVSNEVFTITVPLLGERQISQPVVILLVANLVAGAMAAGIGLCQIQLLSSLCEGRDKAMCIAVHYSILGLLAALGPLLGGYLMDVLSAHPLSWNLPSGEPVSFFHILVVIYILVVCGIGAPCLLKVRLRTGEMPFLMAVGELSVDPLKGGLSMVYGLLLNYAAIPVSNLLTGKDEEKK